MTNKKKEKTDKKILEERLIDIFVNNHAPVVVSLEGSWGSGKTEFWKKFSEEHFSNSLLPSSSLLKASINNLIEKKCILQKKDGFTDYTEGLLPRLVKCKKPLSILSRKKHAYISLFGKESLKEINQDIILQVAMLNSHLKKLEKLRGVLKFKGIDVISSLSIFEQDDISNIIICFDDLERKSQNIDMKDILGLISDLKEQKKCQILVINNKDQLSESDDLSDYEFFKHDSEKDAKGSKAYYLKRSRNNDIYKKYSEKIFDYRLHYDPTPEENFNLVKHTLKRPFDSAYIIKLLEDGKTIGKEKNIRLMKNLINKLNIFSFLGTDLNSNVEKTIILHIFNSVYEIKSAFSIFDHVSIASLIPIIDRSLKQEICLDKDIFISETNILSNQRNAYNIVHDINLLHERNLYDLKYPVSQYFNDLKEVISKNMDNIFSVLGLQKVVEYINLLKQYSKTDNETELDALLDTAIKKGIDQLFDNSINYASIMEDSFLSPIEAVSDDLKRYIDQKKTEHRKKFLSDPAGIITLVNKIRRAKGWNPSDVNMLALISVSDHKDYILNNKDYFEALHAFVMVGGLAGAFSGLFSNFRKALKELADMKDDYGIKLKKLNEILNPEEPNTSP